MRHEKSSLIGLARQRGVPADVREPNFFENSGLPLAQEIIAGGDVVIFSCDTDTMQKNLNTLSANAELRAIGAVRAHARESVTLGDAHWREIHCHVVSLSDNRIAVRVTVSGIAARSLGSDALAGAAAALTTLAAPFCGALIEDLRVYAIDIEGRERFQHPCPLPADIAHTLPSPRQLLAKARCAVITLSDRASQGIYEDKSGARLAQIITAQGGLLVHSVILPDDGDRLASEIDWLSRRGDIDLLVCTGGTGIGPRDITPDTLMQLGIRPVPGIGEMLRAHSANVVRSAWLSRSVAGTIGQMVVIALPGSHKAVVECMEALLPLLPHTLSMLHGGGHD
jgi:molybdenum cofactor synthesis domain-containing protein